MSKAIVKANDVTVGELRQEFNMSLEEITPGLKKLRISNPTDETVIKGATADKIRNTLQAIKDRVMALPGAGGVTEEVKIDDVPIDQQESQSVGITELPKGEIKKIAETHHASQNLVRVLHESLQAQTIRLAMTEAFILENQQDEIEEAAKVGKAIAQVQKSKRKLQEIEDDLAYYQNIKSSDANEIMQEVFGFRADELENKAKSFTDNQALEAKVKQYTKAGLSPEDIEKVLLEEGYDMTLVKQHLAKKNCLISSDLANWL